MALTKEKLISRLQTQVGLSKQESRSTVERVLDIMKESLAQGEDLLISGFGKFSVRQKNARRGRNPQTKENLILRARKVVVFKTSGVLRNLINGSSSSRPLLPPERGFRCPAPAGSAGTALGGAIGLIRLGLEAAAGVFSSFRARRPKNRFGTRGGWGRR